MAVFSAPMDGTTPAARSPASSATRIGAVVDTDVRIMRGQSGVAGAGRTTSTSRPGAMRQRSRRAMHPP
ncbi:MAG: hypothetical protein HOW59_19125 [Nonomuraea sp.]|nr:hypothetical protein [Nonomuraea sp.]